MTTEIIERTNQRDGVVYFIDHQDGGPLCPHCGAKMTKVDGRWENALCPCWWAGSDDATYPRQVVIAGSSVDEFAFRSTFADRLEEKNVQRQDEMDAARLAYAASSEQERKAEIIIRLRYLYGKQWKRTRDRIRKVIHEGGDFDSAMSAK